MSDRAFPLPELKREGYPWISDPDHPLWDAMSAGWPDHTPEQAMREAIEHQAKQSKRERGFVDSSEHPAFLPGFVSNAQAEQPGEPEPDAVVLPPANRR